MKVFKFGGASVKSADAVKNVQSIISRYSDRLVVVVSAMGKTTNALEEITKALFDNDKDIFTELVNECRYFHLQIMNELFDENNLSIFDEVNQVFDSLIEKKNQVISDNYDFLYDQIVSLGEVVSTLIVSAYLAQKNEKVCWKDARTFLRTNDKYRAAKIDWEITQQFIKEEIFSSDCQIIVTQGFLGHTVEGNTTTLGREGSDFTAAIIAYCIQAESVTIWKDVPGMLNADPKWFSDTVKLDKISFKEAIELAYYGASVIHPKTIQPLQNKNIPLYIKSFIHPAADGSVIQESMEFDGLVPSFIVKTKQILLSLTPKDFSFVVEENLRDIFEKLAQFGAHINVMQNAAVSFTVCMDIDAHKLDALIQEFQKEYKVKYNTELELLTIRHYDQETIDRVVGDKEILMEQRTRHTVRIVMR
ncbi:MAG: aspartate kinase [Brumimicrobium sp.]|nr:aspartate kinase [Brumimicrobium sp.]